MDSATGTLLGGIVIGFGGLFTALAGGLIKQRSDNKTLAAQVELNRAAIAQKDNEIAAKRESDQNSLSNQMREELRGDNKHLRQLIMEQDAHINQLSSKIDALTAKVKLTEEGREKAEADSRLWQSRYTQAAALATDWQKKYEGEANAAGLLAKLYEYATQGREADKPLIALAEERLRETGHISGENNAPVSPPPPPSASPILFLPPPPPADTNTICEPEP